MARKLLIVALVLVALVVMGGLLVRRLVDPEALRVALERQATATLGQPVKVGRVDWSGLARPRVVLHEVQVGSPAAITLARVEVAASLRALLARRVEDAGLVIAGGRIQLPLPFQLGGGATAAPPIEGEEAALTIASVDRISLSDIELVAKDARVTLDVESSLSGDRLAVSRLRLRSGKTSVEGSGEFSSLAARRGMFTTTADPLDLDEVLTIASAFSGPASGDASPVVEGQPLALDVRVEVKAPRGRVLGMDFTDLATTIALAPGGVTLEPFGVGVFGGAVDGRLTVDTTGASSRVAVSAAVSSIDVARMAAFAGTSGVITGRLGGRIDLQASGGTPDVVFRTAGGRATLAVTDGTIPGLDLVGPAIRAFGTTGGATAGATPAGRSNAFSSIRGNFSLANGVLRTSDLAMASRDLDVKGQGTLRVEGASVDMRADLILSEALTSEAGRDLVRYAREGNRVVLPATIRGGLASPSVSIDVQAAAKRALRNTVEDEIKKGLGRLFRP